MTDPGSSSVESRAPALSGRTYVVSFVALVALTLASFWLSYAHLGPLEVVVALGIAAVKVSIVGLFFMHLVNEPSSHRIVAVVAVLFVAILAAFAGADLFTRHS